MFKLLRRISYGVIPRPDRPWEDDPTSSAPQTGKKRRLSSTEREVDGDDDKANIKKARGESATPSVADADGIFAVPALPAAGTETEEVKEVTQGVEDVALEEKDTQTDINAAPESIPLPDERSGELDEPTSDASSSPAAEPSIDSLPVKVNLTEDAPSQEEGELGIEESIESAKSSERDTTLPEKGTVERAKKIFESNNTEQPSEVAVPTEE